MNATCSDFRFTDNSTNGVLLPHWTETCTASVNATVWLKANLSVGNNTVYVYYNNSAALSASNVSSTFTKSFGANDLQGEWQMDENTGTTIADVSGNSYTGTLAGGTAWVAPDGGFIANNSANRFSYGSTLKFTNTGDIVKIGNITKIRPNTNWTIMIWVNATSVAQYGNILDTNYAPSVQRGLHIEYDNLGARKLYAGIYDGTTYQQFDLLNSTVPTNVWMFIAVRKNGTLISTFLNSTNVANVNWGGSNSFPKFDNLTLGTAIGDNPATRQFKGVQDGLQVFNRSLSNAEISNYYFRRKYTSPEPVVLTVGAEETQSSDTTPPSINIQSPANKTYNAATIDLNFSLSENASSCIYELDGVNTTIIGCQNVTIFRIFSQSYAEAQSGNSGTTGTWNTTQPVANTNDENWGTYGECIDGTCGSLPWYNKPFNATEAKWEHKTAGSQSNTSIPASCLNAYSDKIVLYMYTQPVAYTAFDCYDGFSYNNLFWEVPSRRIYEEGIWWILNKTLSDGSHSIKLWANDTANNWNVSQTISFTIDTTYPSITIQSPANNSLFSTTNISLNYTASESLSTCKYELNGVANVSLAGCANTTFTAASGSNTIRVYVNDTANNWNSSMVSFTVDNTPPVITIQAPTNQTYGTVSVALNYTVSDDLGVSQCKYELNGGANVSLANCANTTLTAAVGNNSVKVWANDTANNWGVSSSIAFKVDTVFPVWTLNNFPKSDNSTVVNGSIAWDARVSDANLYRILLNVTSAANGSSVYSLYESDWNLTQYNFTGTTDTSGWAEGKYIAEFSATDDHTFGGLRGLNYTVDGYKMFFGNGKTNYSFVFQTKNPDGTIMPLAMSADLSTLISYNSTRKEYKWGYALKLPNPSFRATVFLNSSTDRIVLRNASMAHFVIGDFYVDFKDVLQAGYLLNVSNGSGGYFIDIWKESYGVAPNSVIVIDPVSGGTNTQTEFYSFNVDHSVPTIVLNSPINNSWTNNNTPVFNITTTDNIAASGSCNLTVDNVRMAAGTWTNNTPFTMSNTTALAAGTHYWNATCVDSAGNLKTSQTFAVSIDTVNPNVVCVSCPVSSSSSSLTFSVTATDALSGVNVSRLFYRGAYYTMSKSGDTYSYSLTENNNGEYSYQFFVNDTAGNLNSTVTGSVVVGASTSTPPGGGGGGGGGGGDALTVADLLGKLQNITQQKPVFGGENVSYIARPAADVTNVNLSALMFDYGKLGEPYYILPTNSPNWYEQTFQHYVPVFPKWSVLVPISAITGLISTAAFGGGWGGAVWAIATYFEAYKIVGLNTWVNVNGTLVALNATVGG